MKLTLFFLIAVLLHVHASTYGQKINLKLSNAPLEKVFDEITIQTGYNFLYNDNLLKKTHPINLTFNNAPLNEVLDKCMADQPIAYTISQNTIVIKRRTDIKKTVALIDISGRVVDKQGRPLAGVSVKLKGTSQGGGTDPNGNFTIKAIDRNSVLVFSFIGFISQEVMIGDKTVINITMLEEPKSLSEVVVIGYGTQSRATITSAISTVDGKNIGNQPVGTPQEALAGLAPGVQVQSDQGAKPGASPTVRVRGVTSLSSSTDPLYVVDGYPLESSADFTLINPGDIASIDILKDAAAASIYGSRAANGVIIVTTKRGKTGKTVFSFSTYTGLQKVTGLISVLDRDQFISYAKDVARIRNQTYPTNFDASPGSLPDVNWQEQLFRTAPITDVEFNASGGNEKVRFNASAGYFNQEGVMIGTSYNRTTIRMNLDADIVKNVKLGFSVSPSYSEQYREPASGQFNGSNGADQLVGVPGLIGNYTLYSPLNQALTMPPVVPVYRANGDFAEVTDANLQYTLPNSTAFYFPTSYLNPLNIVSQAINRDRAFRTISNAFLTYTPVDGLTLKTYLGGTLENELVHAYIPATMASAQAPNASFSNPSLAGIYASDNARNSFDWVWENTATYDRTIGDHHFNLLGLFSAQKYNSQTNYTAGVPGTFVTTAVQSPLASPNTLGTETFDASDFVSYAARLTYDFKKRYLFTAAVREDGSSRFGPNNRYAVFPSFSAGWRLSEEQFAKPILKDLDISELKLRGSFGKTGNADIGSFTYLNSIAFNHNYASGSTRLFGTQQTGFANPDLTWEKNTETDLGIDLGLLDNRIYFTADYFDRTTDGMLLNKALPLIVGYATSYQANLGSLQNKGLDFGANTNFSIGAVHWTVNANLSTYRTKVLSLGGPSSLPAVPAVFGWNNAYQVKVGQPLGVMYGYTVEGVFKNATDLADHAQVTGGNHIGDWIIKDQNGDGKIDANDITPLGHGLPDFTYGLTNSFQYKSFDLSILIQGVQGVNTINGNLRQLYGGNGNLNTTTKYYQNYFDPAQPNRNVEFPLPGNSSSISTANALTNVDVENGSYLRVRNITLGYRFSDAFAKKISLKTLRLYATAQNPFLITKYSGYNPETSVNGADPTTPGVDQGTYPIARTFIFGVNVGF
ncbi:TonB-dependent receptor [Mucilaginibacter sp. X5P1]|uniref:TonB-dependent receptor n=1 Tax=Mucilaginibacter sp. X5P1 TaxID=2723088 RepID=UPI00161C93E7|nr:TonB-dependent receptor [Mucilaginibacter sp. X5P1]MBB6141935.1 TonB-linked SusC/RagA family outer membrane protein [Mucilaginibacter sp. X5P1]